MAAVLYQRGGEDWHLSKMLAVALRKHNVSVDVNSNAYTDSCHKRKKAHK
jgi:hypothetical protein